MKPKYSFFIITHFNELCCLRYQSRKKKLPCKQPMSHMYHSFCTLTILGASFSQSSPTFLSSLVLTLPAPKIRSPDLFWWLIQAANYLQKYKKFKSTCIFLSRGKEGITNLGVFSIWTIFLYSKTCGNGMSSESLLFPSNSAESGEWVKGSGDLEAEIR